MFPPIHRKQQHFLQGWQNLGELYKNAAPLLHPLVALLWPFIERASTERGHSLSFLPWEGGYFAGGGDSSVDWGHKLA